MNGEGNSTVLGQNFTNLLGSWVSAEVNLLNSGPYSNDLQNSQPVLGPTVIPVVMQFNSKSILIIRDSDYKFILQFHISISARLSIASSILNHALSISLSMAHTRRILSLFLMGHQLIDLSYMMVTIHRPVIFGCSM